MEHSSNEVNRHLLPKIELIFVSFFLTTMQNYCRENQLERAIRRHSNIIENWTNYRSAIRKIVVSHILRYRAVDGRVNASCVTILRLMVTPSSGEQGERSNSKKRFVGERRCRLLKVQCRRNS